MAANGYVEHGFKCRLSAHYGNKDIGALVSAAMLGIPATGDPSSASTADTGVVDASGITAPTATLVAATASIPITVSTRASQLVPEAPASPAPASSITAGPASTIAVLATRPSVVPASTAARRTSLRAQAAPAIPAPRLVRLHGATLGRVRATTV